MSGLQQRELDGVWLLSFSRPMLSRQVLTELGAALDRLHGTSEPVVVGSSHPSIFLAGAHLGEIQELDSHSSRAYAGAGRQVMARLRAHPAPVVAAVNGSCSGGGFDLVLSCDAVVCSPAARFSHPGVQRGLVTGWGGTALLPAALGRAATRAALLQARLLTADDLAVAGAVLPCDHDVTLAAAAEARRLGSLHASRLTLWRQLREGRFVDRFRTVMVHNEWREESVMSVVRRS